MSRWFWPSVVVGWGCIAVGVGFALAEPGATQPPALAIFVVGLLLVHDLIVAPATCAVGMRMHAKGARRAPLVGAMVATVVITAFSVPFIAGWGLNPDNPSFLPGHYVLGLLGTLIIVWTATSVLLVRATRSTRAAA